MNQDKTFLGTEPVGKLLLKLAIPTVVAQLVNRLYLTRDMVDVPLRAILSKQVLMN